MVATTWNGTMTLTFTFLLKILPLPSQPHPQLRYPQSTNGRPYSLSATIQMSPSCNNMYKFKTQQISRANCKPGFTMTRPSSCPMREMIGLTSESLTSQIFYHSTMNYTESKLNSASAEIPSPNPTSLKRHFLHFHLLMPSLHNNIAICNLRSIQH